MSTHRFVATEELQVKIQDLLREVSETGEPCYITQKGMAKAVIIDITRYNQIMDLVEEAESLKQKEVGDETRKYASVRGILKESSRRYK